MPIHLHAKWNRILCVALKYSQSVDDQSKDRETHIFVVVCCQIVTRFDFIWLVTSKNRFLHKQNTGKK